VFEDAVGTAKLVSSEALSSLFSLFSEQVKCVLLNACYSEFQAKAISQHVDYVIGMSQAIGDRAAIEFAVGFYTALGAGRSIEFAYQLGCNAIQLDGVPGHSTPLLFKKRQVSPLSYLFPRSPTASRQNDFTNQTRSFRCSADRMSGLVQSVQNWLASEDFNCQKLLTEDGGILLQIEKKGRWRQFVGMSTALNIVFRQVENTINVEIGAGRWIDKAACGAVSLIMLWPLAVTAGFGAWQLLNMPKRLYEQVDKYLQESIPITH
jgi:hypothetical protein